MIVNRKRPVRLPYHKLGLCFRGSFWDLVQSYRKPKHFDIRSQMGHPFALSKSSTGCKGTIYYISHPSFAKKTARKGTSPSFRSGGRVARHVLPVSPRSLLWLTSNFLLRSTSLHRNGGTSAVLRFVWSDDCQQTYPVQGYFHCNCHMPYPECLSA